MEDVSGWFIYNNILIQQHKNVGKSFTKLLNEVKPKRILEIGTASGGLTLLLRDILDELSLNDTILRSYDVIDKHYLHEQISNGKNIEVIIKDVFNHQYSELKEKNEIIDFIQGDGVTVVLCDGGSKKNEFNILSNYLKHGDIIMAHDYSPNDELFNQKIKDKIWNWLEIQDSDITDCVERNNLSPFMVEEFMDVVWVCKIKE
jgi:predicted O-methyltransferase YrrM